MKVHVKAFATFREVMDSQFDMDFPHGATIRTLLAELHRKVRRVGRADVCQSGNTSGTLSISSRTAGMYIFWPVWKPRSMTGT